MDPNGYLALAQYDLRLSKKNLDWGDYNPAARYAQQAVEKYLKHILELSKDAEAVQFMKLHNLKRLHTEAKNRVQGTPEISRANLALLTDYYFDTNYPGDDFQWLDKEQAKEAYEIAKEFLENPLLNLEEDWEKDSESFQ